MSPSGGVARSTELWDPRTGAWSAGGDMLEPRLDHTATALLDGRVLVAGGAQMVWATHPGVGSSYANAFPRPVATAEIWDPHARQWQPVGRLPSPRRLHTATRLRDGRILITGGTGEYVARDSLDDHPPLATAALFDPATGRWSSIAPMGRPRFGHAATLLHDGRVLVIGPATSTEIWDPGSGRWTEGPPLNLPRQRHEAVTLSDGRVLVAGGPESCNESTDVSEVLDQAATRWQVTPPFRLKRCHPALVALPDGGAIALGSLLRGSERNGADAWPAEIWSP
jgi:hypothetical protein